MNNQTINTIIKYSIITGLAIITFIPLYVANPLFFPFITGKAFAFRIIVDIIFALWIALIIRERGTSVAGTNSGVAPRINLITIFVTIFTIVILIADLLGVNPIRSIWSNFERMEGWMTIVHLWAYFMVLSSVINTKENWNKFFNVILVSGLMTAFYGLFQLFGWAEVHQSGSRLDASLGNAAYMAVYMLINSFIAGYMAIDAYRSTLKFKKQPLVWVYSILFLLFGFIIFETATRGSVIGWLVAILIACAFYVIFGRKGQGQEKGQSNKSRAIIGGIIGLIIVLGLLFYFNRNVSWIKNNPNFGRLATISLSEIKTQGRAYIWPMAVKGVFSSPKTSIIGWGQENFNYIFNANYNPAMYAQEQWFDRAHSVYLDWLVSGGIIGLLLYLSLYLISLIYIWKSQLSIGQKALLIGLMVGYGIHNFFVFDNQTSYVMFFTFLAFIHSLKAGKKYSWLGSSTKSLSEDGIVVQNYIYIPIIIILFVSGFYFINIRPIQANTRLITALRSCSDAKTVSAKLFEDSLKLDQTVANQEIREQLFNCAGNVIRSNLTAKTKGEFYDLVKKETDKQIKSTPNDARIYIIAGSFYDAIRDWDTARPLLEKAMALSPTKQSIIMELATNYLNSNRSKDALVLMEKAYLSATSNVDAKIGYIISLISAGQEKKARELFGADNEIFSDQRVLNAFISAKEYSKAIDAYKKILLKNPQDKETYSALASAYLQDGQNYMAIQTLKTLADKFPELKTQIDPVIKEIQDGKFKL